MDILSFPFFLLHQILWYICYTELLSIENTSFLRFNLGNRLYCVASFLNVIKKNKKNWSVFVSKILITVQQDFLIRCQPVYY